MDCSISKVDASEIGMVDSKPSFDPPKKLTIASKGYTQVGSEVLELDVRGEIDNVLSLVLSLHEDLVLSHDLDDLADVAAWLLEQLELLA